MTKTVSCPKNAKFHVNVWAIPVKRIGDKFHLQVGLLADQENLLKAQKCYASKLPKGVQLISCLGGRVKTVDTNLEKALERTILETTGCSVRTTEFEHVIESMELWDKSLSFWMPVVLHGQPQPSKKYLEYPWISYDDFLDESKYLSLERWTWRWQKQTEPVKLVLIQAFEFFMRRHYKSQGNLEYVLGLEED